ncbi:hypothetical protein BGZ65_004425 [Modicella reniformis]|uniref:Uncharacterized protein n=1 Tax=Modicella reniformis TaxID=1440133 RepID=A0A9P6IZ51_9FUNG|nr:hypothetical protein BGZ65_004425 [Modicella reniformis]
MNTGTSRTVVTTTTTTSSSSSSSSSSSISSTSTTSTTSPSAVFPVTTEPKDSVSTKLTLPPPSTDLAPSTTPKQPPKVDYYKFLRDGNAINDFGTNNESDTNGVSRVQQPHLGKALGASVMDFARRSIMEHATTSPQTVIKKINKVVAESKGQPSLTELLTATDTRNSQANPPPANAAPKTSFTFESCQQTTTTHPPLSDDAQYGALGLLGSSNSNEGAARTLVAPSRVDGIRTDEGNNNMIRNEATTDRRDSSNMLREVLDTEASLQRGPHLATVSRASIASRTIPHKVPTINEREALRKSKGPGFRARPVDPRVFTSAGDLGVPRIRKQPLTRPVSPVFSKPRVKPTVATSPPIRARSASTAKLENLLRIGVIRRPVTYPATRVKRVETLPSKGSTADMKTTTRNQPNTISTRSDLPAQAESSSRVAFSGNVPAIYPTTLASRESRFGIVAVLPVKRNAIRGPPLREECSAKPAPAPAPAAVSEQLPDDCFASSTVTKRPLTQPVPFKFATDELLRKRRAMFRPSGAVSVPTKEPNTDGRVDRQTGAIKRPQPPLKRFTVPVPFQLATQRRAEMHAHHHHHHHEGDAIGSHVHSTSTGTRLTGGGRLAGLPPLRSSFAPASTSAAVTQKHKDKTFKPTVPIPPKFGQRVQVRALQPSRFLLKKSTKALTQPTEFRFHSDQRSKERELLQQSMKRQEQELMEIRETSLRLSKNQEQRTKAPIKQYQPVMIRKANKPLTQPVSPMIGEKRKRREMELRVLGQQQQQEQDQDQWLEYESVKGGAFQQHPRDYQGSHHRQIGVLDSTETLRSGLRRKLSQEVRGAQVSQEQQHWEFQFQLQQHQQQEQQQQQLTSLERRQLELANSSRATIRQPPIRLLFPVNSKQEALVQTSDKTDRQTDDIIIEQPNFTPPLPEVRDSFGGNNDHHLSRELRRISLEASRGSGNDSGSGSGYDRGRDTPDSRQVQAAVEHVSSSNSSSGGGGSSDRRRSGSFIPLDRGEPSRRSPAPKMSSSRILVPKFYGTTLQASASTSRSSSSSSKAQLPVSEKTRSKGPVMIEHTLTLSDL